MDAQENRAQGQGSAEPPSRGPDAKRPYSYVGWLGAAALAELCLIGAHAVSRALAPSPLLAYGLGFAAVAASTIGTAFASPLVPKRALGWLVVPALSIWLVARSGASELEVALVVTASLLLGGTLLGSVVGSAIEHAGHLLFVAIVSAAADTVSVFHPSGPSAAISQSKEALSLLALPWPMLGTPHLEAFLGAGDVVFTALYVTSCRKLGLSTARTALALTLAYAVTMVAVIVLEVPVPALPMLGLAVIVAHPQARHPPREDRARGFALSALAVGLAVFLLLR